MGRKEQEIQFLEMEVVTSEHLLWSRYLSKAKVAVEAKDRAFVRVPHGKDGYSALDRFIYFRNTILRICDCCTHPEDVYKSAVHASIELLGNMWRKQLVCHTLKTVASQKRMGSCA